MRMKMNMNMVMMPMMIVMRMRRRRSNSIRAKVERIITKKTYAHIPWARCDSRGHGCRRTATLFQHLGPARCRLKCLAVEGGWWEREGG